MVGLAQLATPKRYTNVLQHVAVYFKGSARCASKHEKADTNADYRHRLVPLVSRNRLSRRCFQQ